MKLKNNTKRRFELGGQALAPEAIDEFPDSFAAHPVVKALLKRGELEIVTEDNALPAEPKPKPTDSAEVEALLKKIGNAKRDTLVKLCGEYGLQAEEGDEAKDLKVKLNAFLTGGEEDVTTE